MTGLRLLLLTLILLTAWTCSCHAQRVVRVLVGRVCYMFSSLPGLLAASRQPSQADDSTMHSGIGTYILGPALGAGSFGIVRKASSPFGVCALRLGSTPFQIIFENIKTLARYHLGARWRHLLRIAVAEHLFCELREYSPGDSSQYWELAS